MKACIEMLFEPGRDENKLLALERDKNEAFELLMGVVYFCHFEPAKSPHSRPASIFCALRVQILHPPTRWF